MSNTGSFGRRLRELRQENGISLSTLALHLGCSKGHLSKIETGHSKPSPDLATKCDAAFGTTIFGKLVEDEMRQAPNARTSAAKPTQVRSNEIDQAFEELYRTEKNALLAYVRAHGVAPDGAAVIVQDVMLECFQRWSTIDHPRTWIRGVAKKKMLEHWRREGRRRGELGVGDPQLAVELAKLASPSAEAEVMSDASLVALCKQLPHRQKAVIVKVLTGMMPAEIADELHISEAGVRSHIRMARQTLRVAFEREAFQSSLEAGDLVSAGQACENLATALLRLQRSAEARAIWQRAANVYRQAGAYVNASNALIELSAALHEAGEYEEARRIFRNALELVVDAPPQPQGIAFLAQNRSARHAADVRPHREDTVRAVLDAINCDRFSGDVVDVVKAAAAAFQKHGEALQAQACPKAGETYWCAKALFEKAGDTDRAAEIEKLLKQSGLS